MTRGRAILARVRHPQTTVRWRLALLYGGLFLASGATLLAVTYALVSNATVSPPGSGLIRSSLASNRLIGVPATWPDVDGRIQISGGQAAPALNSVIRSPAGRAVVRIVGSQQRISDLHQLEIESGIALAIMAILSGGLGWLVAGRVLRPLRTITATTQQISEANLHERLAMDGPPDELRRLADTIDGLLQRLESAFDAQRRFVANASHELRTPLSAERALIEMVMSDPGASVGTFREMCGQLLEESERQEELIEALLTLAQGQRGLERAEPVELAALTRGVIGGLEADIAVAGLVVGATLNQATTTGDSRLIERLVANLVGNAIEHNVPGGTLLVQVHSRAGQAILRVENTGSEVPAHEVARLLAPFQRLGAERTGHGEGLGLGLSIVAAICAAHHAGLEVAPRPSGGLEVEVSFQTAAPADPPERVGEAPSIGAVARA